MNYSYSYEGAQMQPPAEEANSNANPDANPVRRMQDIGFGPEDVEALLQRCEEEFDIRPVNNAAVQRIADVLNQDDSPPVQPAPRRIREVKFGALLLQKYFHVCVLSACFHSSGCRK